MTKVITYMYVSFLEIRSKTLAENQVANVHLTENWQDWILANVIAVNYLNSLLVLTSKNNFTFTVPAYYSVRQLDNSGSFSQSISLLTTRTRIALSGARQDLNRVHAGMEKVPGHLKIMILLVKEGPFDLISTLFPDSFSEIEKLVNDSLIVLRKPENNFEQVLNLLTEIDYLVNVTAPDQMISFQVYDVKTQWQHLTELIIELAKQAERAREAFLLQLNWVLEEFMRSGSSHPDSLRDFIISLLLPKIVELDRACDLLGMITKTYSDISSQFSDEQIGGNGHLPLLSDETTRERYLNQFRHDLPPQVVQIARVALKENKQFLERDKNRQKKYETYLTEVSSANLASLIR